MASLLRQIAALPFSWRSEYGLDFSYVTTQIIATSGPSSTYPKRAYRNPDNKLVKFLDDKHSEDWAIWEFRAEGTGYSDDKMYGRVNHFPWPDHQPPPFGLVIEVIASMRNWLNRKDGRSGSDHNEKSERVAVLHCRAGKGRSGTIACAYLISECGWAPDKALARFTKKRMRSGFGEGVSIPSQLRWVGYVDRWTKNRSYRERPIEIQEIHVWGVRDDVEVSIKGYVQAGKEIQTFHTFTNEERRRGELRALPIEFGAKYSGHVVIFKPAAPVILPTSDVNVTFKRYIHALSSWKIASSVAHIWFNAFFEGNGPEKNGQADEEGVFESDWGGMDGFKCFKQKGTRALNGIAIVWKAYHPAPATEAIHERA